MRRTLAVAATSTALVLAGGFGTVNGATDVPHPDDPGGCPSGWQYEVGPGYVFRNGTWYNTEGWIVGYAELEDECYPEIAPIPPSTTTEPDVGISADPGDLANWSLPETR
jgi:hypothetical protein